MNLLKVYLSGLVLLMIVSIPAARSNPELFKAIESEDIEKVLQLIKQGVDLNEVNHSAPGHLRLTPLCAALDGNGWPNRANIDLVRTLLSHGASPDIYGLPGEPRILPLFIAVDARRPDIVNLLLDNGADISLTLPNRTILFAAVQNLKILQTLLQAGAGKYINYINKSGWSVLSVAALSGKTNCFRLLLQSADLRPETLNTIHRDGGTALHFACQFGTLDIARSILNHEFFNHSLINHPDNNGKTPYQLAKLRDHPDIAELLLEHGALATDLPPINPYPECPACYNNVFSHRGFYGLCARCNYALCGDCYIKTQPCPLCSGPLLQHKMMRQLFDPVPKGGDAIQ